MKKIYDSTVLFYIKTLKNQKKIKTWMEGALIYYDLTKENINPKTLSNVVSRINFEEININKFLDICTKHEIKVEDEAKEANEENKNKSNSLLKTLSITDENYKNIFNVDLEKDTEEEINMKVLRKINSDDGKFLLTYLGFNPGEYEIQKISMGSWSTPVKTRKDNTLVIVLNDKFNVEIVKRKKKVPFYTEEECKEFLNKFLKEEKLSPFDLFEKQPKLHNPLHDNLLIVCPGLELHLGKLGSVADFEDYSAKQSMWRIKKVAKEVFKYQDMVKASQLLLGIGNDFYNTDTTKDETTAGTPQNNDTRFKECYLWGKVGYLKLIETLKPIFDKVRLQGMPGNHDEKTSFSLLTNLYDIYTMTDDPKIETSLSYKDIRFTTAYEFGDNLLVFSHGKTPEGKNLKDSELASKVVQHFPEESRRAKKIYIFAGHTHIDSEQVQNDPRITVIRTASLSGVESWAYSNNYIGQREGHSVFLIDKKLGYVGKHNITLSDEEKKSKIVGMSRNENVNIVKAMEKALSLNEKSVSKEIKSEELRDIDSKLRDLRIKYLHKLKELCVILKIDLNDLDESIIDEVLEKTEYSQEKKMLEKEKEMILSYK